MNASSPLNRLSPGTIWTLLLVIITVTYACNFLQPGIPVTGTEEPANSEEPAAPKETPIENPTLSNPEVIFRANNTSLQKGECAILEWDFKGVEVVQLNGDPVNRSANKEVCPIETTTYTLSGFAGGGPPVAEKVVVINVSGNQQSQPTQASENPAKNNVAPPAAPAAPAAKSCPGKPVISYFNANPLTIDAGQSTVLSWDAVNNSPAGSLQDVTIDNGVGGVGGNDTRTVKPGKTTTYSLTADGCGGSVKRTVTVTVNAPQAAPPGGGSAGVLTADLRVTDLFPDNLPVGTVFTRVVNNGPGHPTNIDIQLSCKAFIVPTGIVAPGYYVYQTDTININSSPGQEVVHSTGIGVDTSKNTYDVTCTISTPFNDPNASNNSYTEKIP